MNVRDFVAAFIVVEEDGAGGSAVRHRIDPDLPVVLVDGDEAAAAEISRVVLDSGQVQVWVGDPAVLSHKVTGEPKPETVARLEARLADVERRLAGQQQEG